MVNDNLEAVAQTIIQNYISKNGERKTVGDVIALYDYKRIPLSSMERSSMNKVYPYYGAATMMDYVDNYIFDGIYGLLGEDGTVIDENGYPTMQYVWGKFWVNNHAHIFQGKNGYSTELVYLILKRTIVRDAVTGAVQLKINQDNLNKLAINVPNKMDIPKIDNLIGFLFSTIRKNTDEIEKLMSMNELILSNLSR